LAKEKRMNCFLNSIKINLKNPKSNIHKKRGELILIMKICIAALFILFSASNCAEVYANDTQGYVD
jgi:hypothetical protein